MRKNRRKKKEIKAEKQRQANRKKEIIDQVKFHTMKIQSDIHECLLANTSDLQHYGVKRVQHATCNYYLKWSNCKKLASLSCERCDFDLCESCSGLAKLPLEERNERKRKYDNIEKVRKEEEQKRRKLEFDKREAERQQKDQLKK